MSYIFISYVHKNLDDVRRISDELVRNGIDVWIDKDKIKPGERWSYAIRKAIMKSSLFIACFSKEYNRKSTTYMNEELTLAIDLIRKHHRDRNWFIPVLLSGKVPDWDVGAGQTLHDFQWVDLGQDWDGGLRDILEIIK